MTSPSCLPLTPLQQRLPYWVRHIAELTCTSSRFIECIFVLAWKLNERSELVYYAWKRIHLLLISFIVRSSSSFVKIGGSWVRDGVNANNGGYIRSCPCARHEGVWRWEGIDSLFFFFYLGTRWHDGTFPHKHRIKLIRKYHDSPHHV